MVRYLGTKEWNMASAVILEAPMNKDIGGTVVVAMFGVMAGMVLGVMTTPLVAWLVGLLAGQ
jgi:hypothetical protein